MNEDKTAFAIALAVIIVILVVVVLKIDQGLETVTHNQMMLDKNQHMMQQVLERCGEWKAYDYELPPAENTES